MTLQGLFDRHGRLERTIENPHRAMLGRPYRFHSGLTVGDRNLAEKLAWLAWHGVPIGRKDGLSSDPDAWVVDEAEGTIEIPMGGQLRGTFSLRTLDPTIFLETFLYDVHFIQHDLSGWVVLDAGAYVGDTALYFANRGAVVLALEPNPVNQAYFELHLRKNPRLAVQIRFRRAALVGSRSSRATLQGHGTEPTGAAALADDGLAVPTVTLADCLKEIRSSWPGRKLGLKLDIKGEEYRVTECPEVAEFSHVQVEYGNGPGPILKALERAGFHRPRVYRHNFGHSPLSEHGVVSASKEFTP